MAGQGILSPDTISDSEVNNMPRADKSSKSPKRTTGASQDSICPKCGYLLREQGRRCPNCFYQFKEQMTGKAKEQMANNVEKQVADKLEEHVTDNIEEQMEDKVEERVEDNAEEHRGGNVMGKQRSGNMSPSREYLNHLNNQLLRIEAKRVALEELYIPLKMEHDELNNLITSVKHQIKREEALDAIDEIESTESSSITKYKAEISYEEVDAEK